MDAEEPEWSERRREEPEGDEENEGDEGGEAPEADGTPSRAQGQLGPHGQHAPHEQLGLQGQLGPHGQYGPQGQQGSQGPHGPQGQQSPQGPHGRHGHKPSAGERWRAFKDSPFLPASVLVLILAAAAGLFAGSYTYAMANPTPHHIPVAIVGKPNSAHDRSAFVQGMEKGLGSSLELRHFRTQARAERAIEAQQVFAILRVERPKGVELDVSSASGASVAQLLEKAVRRSARRSAYR